MSTEFIQPSTIDGIKRLANQIKKTEGISHAHALDKASLAARCENYAHARRVLENKPPSRLPGYDLYISVLWRDLEAGVDGQEVLKIRVARPLDEILKPPAYREARGLGTMRREGSDHLSSAYVAHSQSRARHEACAAARTFQFMEVTGLRPSKAHRRTHPAGDYSSRIPGADHDSAWFDPVARQHIAVSEPYQAAAKHHGAERAAWTKSHNWEIAATNWRGMYNPDGGCELYLAADASKGYSLAPIVAKLDAAPDPIIEANWDGQSLPRSPIFASPGTIAAAAAKQTQPKSAPRPRGPLNSVEYQMIFSGQQRRPSKRMPIETHMAVGRLLKAVLIGTRARAGVYKRIDSMRSDLDDWVQCEYNSAELPDQTFFDLYYHSLDEADPLARPPVTWDRHIDCLEQVKTLLTSHYPDCVPLRNMLKQADLAIASLKSWTVMRQS
jgi:hypothetical protein